MSLVDVTARASQPKRRNHCNCERSKRGEARCFEGRKREKAVSLNLLPPEPSGKCKKIKKNRFRIDADTRDPIAFSGLSLRYQLLEYRQRPHVPTFQSKFLHQLPRRRSCSRRKLKLSRGRKLHQLSNRSPRVLPFVQHFVHLFERP